MKIQDIYQRYKIMPNLQQHMLTVAAVAAEICEHFHDQPIDKTSIVAACLLHDMGNIVKFDLTRFPDFLKPKGLDYWQEVKEDFQERYGSDEKVAMELIAEELGVTTRIKELMQAVNLAKAKENYLSQDFGKKICEYADNRVSPQGVTSQQDRLDDLARRYGSQQANSTKHDSWKKLYQYSQQIEQQIFKYCDLSPDEITKSRVSDTIDSLKSFVVPIKSWSAEVAELVDAHVSGTCERKLMEVQVLSSALRSLTI